MDKSRFAQSLKAFADASDRRDALRSLSAGGMALLVALGWPESGDAKKKKRGNKKKKCKGGAKKCGKRCIPATNCCTDADCDDGTCIAGSCQCPSGAKSCEGACIPEEHCCNAADCNDGNPCTEPICNGNGTCSYPKRPDFTECGGGKLCSGGICATSPNCLSFGIACVAHNQCCSNFCIPSQPTGICNASVPGQPCLLQGHCASGTCVGFVCTQ
jgi:hypothetical protein